MGGNMRRGDYMVGDSDAAKGQFRDYYVFEVLDKFVLEVLKADVYFYVTAPHNYVPSSRLQEYIASSSRVRVFQFDNRTRPLPPAERLRRGHRHNKTFLPYLVQGYTEGNPFRNQYLNQEWAECMQSVRATESRRGFNYTYVAFGRVDARWQASHPSLSMLDATKCRDRITFWGVAEDDWSGIFDKYFIMERPAASTIESFVDDLNSFDRLEAIYRIVRQQTPIGATRLYNYERFLLHSLRAAGLCIRYMLPVVNERRLSHGFAEILHQGGTWEVTPADPYLKMGWCRYLPKSCCGGNMADFGGDLSCTFDLRRTHGRCMRNRVSLQLPKFPGEPVFPRVPTEESISSSERCRLPTFQLRACCHDPHVHITIRPSKQTIQRWSESPEDVDPEIPSIPSLDGSKWHCLFEDPKEFEENQKRPWRLIGGAECYDLNRFRHVI
eukprot:Skav221783  [mRNA]  locus=scaffold4067:31108:32427:- [translate_table: standard]